MSPSANSDLKPILDRLDRVARGISRKQKVIALCCIAALVLALFLIFSGLDIRIKFTKSARLTFSSISLLLTALLAIIFAVRIAINRLTAKAAALHVESNFPQLERTVSTAVEFGTNPEKARTLSSEQIVELLIAEAERRSRTTNFACAVDSIGARRAGAALAIVGIFCFAYFLAFPDIFPLTLKRFFMPWKNLPPPTLTTITVKPGDMEVRKLSTVDISATVSGRIPSSVVIHYALIPEGKTGGLDWKQEEMKKVEDRHYSFAFARMLDSIKYYVTGGDCQTDEYLLRIYEVPRITRLEMRLVYPDYTGMKPKEIKDAVGPVTALRGTRVEIRGFTNKPIASALLEFMSESRPSIKARRVEGNEFFVDFVVIENDKYRLKVTDDRGRTNEDAIFYSIKAIEDKPPVVKITRPGKTIAAVKTTEIPLTVEASDDFGVTEVGIAYKIKTEDEKRFVIQKPADGTKTLKADETFYLELLKLADTDVVSYYAYARDNDAFGGPKESVSDLYFIEIEPFAQQYRYADAGGMPLAQKKEAQDLAATVEKMIKRQQQVIRRTFNLDRIPEEKRTDADTTEIKNLASEENDLRKKAEFLADDLSKKLKAAGLDEQMDRVDNLSKAAAQLGLAAFVLESLDTEKALPYENEALYHLYRAKRDIVYLISLAQNAKDPELRRKLRQALELAMKRQQTLEELERQKQLKELREKAREMANLLEQQKQLNQQLRQEAAQAASSGQPSPQQQQKMDELAKQQAKMKEKAEKEANALREMDFENPRQSYEAARRAAEAAMEMGETERTLKERKIAEARDHGTKAEKNLERAIREVQRALEETVKDQLRAAAQDAQRIAQEQKKLREKTEQLATAQKQLQQQAQAKGTTPQKASAAQTGKSTEQAAREKPEPAEAEKPETARKKSAEGKAPEKETAAQPTETEQAAAALAKEIEKKAQEIENKAREIAQQQKELAKDMDELGNRLREIAPKVGDVEPETGREVASVAEQIRKGDAQRRMQAAANALNQKTPARAAAQQKDAEKKTEAIAQKLRNLAEQFEMDDTRRLARAVQRAKELTKKQDEINEGMQKLAAKVPEAPAPEQLQQKQQEVQRGAEELTKQTNRISSLEKSGLRRSIQQSLASARERMQQVQTQLQRKQPQQGLEAGKQAAEELRQTTKAMERMLNEALTDQLAQAVEKAKKAETAQRQAMEGLKQALEKLRKPRDIPQDKRNRIERDQAEAKQHLADLNQQLNKVAAQAQASGEKQISESLRKTAEELQQERAADRMTAAQKALDRKQWEKALQNQQSAAKSLASARERLEEIYRDKTALPLQKMKEAAEETTQLAEKVDEMRKKVEEAEKAGRGAAQKLKELAKQQKELTNRTERLMERLERIDPDIEKEKIEEVKVRMKQAGDQISRGHTKEVSHGLSKAYQALQSIGEGLIEKLQQLVDKSKRREPEEEEVPEEYKPLAERYSRALSEK